MKNETLIGKKREKTKMVNYSSDDSSDDSIIENKSKLSSDFKINPYTKKPYSKKYYEILEKRKQLPAWETKKKLFELIDKNQIIVLKGETGSGKTTQIPQFLLEKFKCIACTQPRRVAAMSVARRVAEEMDVKLGEEVGYSIRFEDNCSEKTILRYMTDGMLLKEAMSDNLLRRYDLIVLDECHERTLATEIIFGFLKEILQNKRKDLKVVVMSATIDINKFVEYFNNAPVLEVSGRLFDVEINYLKETCEDYIEEAISTAVRIHENEDEGDILIFLTGEEEIENTCQRLREEINEEEFGNVNIIPLYSTLPPYLQQKIFDDPPSKNKKGRPGRKIIVSTNIAETSITIDGVVYVIDSGYSKQKVYNPRLRMESLLVSPISKANAKQRAGRAGRTREGKCFRLFTKETYKELEKTSFPEILRSNMTSVILSLLKLNIQDIVHFDFMDPPAPETMMRSLQFLIDMEAIDNEGNLTEEGSKIANIPLDPELAKVLLSSHKFNTVNEILTIVSMLSVPNVFLRPRNMQYSADDSKKKFSHPSGDHISTLIVYNTFKSKKESESFCKQNFLNYKNLKNADNIRNQLDKMLVNQGVITSDNTYPIEFSDKKVEKILKTMLTGCFSQVCCLELAGYYLTVKENQMVLMHPSCSLSYKPNWVLYHDFVCTGKNYIRTLSKIQPEYLLEVAPKYYDINEFSGRMKKELVKAAMKLYENDENMNEDKFTETKDKEVESVNKLKDINEKLLKENASYSKYSAIKKYKVNNN